MEKDQYKLGLVSVSFRQHSPKEILEATKRAGLSCIEWGSDVHAPCHDVERLVEIAALQEEYGICCSSYGTYFKFGKHSVDELEAYIKAAKLLGTNVLRLWCGRTSGAEMTDAERQTLLGDCRRAAALAETYGVMLCMECHQKTFTERAEDAIWLMGSVASPHFRMYWQPFCEETPAENLTRAKMLAPRTEHLHVFNWKGDAMLPLGDAVEEWRSYLASFSTPRTLLLEFMPDGRIESLPAEAAALMRITGGDK